MSKLTPTTIVKTFFGARSGVRPAAASVTGSPRITSLVLLLCCLSFQAFGQLQHNDPGWVTTWTSSPSTLPSQEAPAATLNNQTARLIVHTSAGGQALRLRFSNTHGNQPIELGAVTVAGLAAAGSIEAGSVRPITFSGQQHVTIPRWATVISDPIAMEVPSAGNLAISFYLPGDSGFVTTHALSNQTNYLSAAGNHVNATDLPVAEETAGWPLLSAVDVLTESPISTIVTLGDSITDGWGSTDSANRRWPDHLARRLYANNNVINYAVANAGISGNRVTTEDSPRFGQNLQARFQRDVLALTGVSHIILLEGINDIGMSSREGRLIDAAEIISGYRQIIARAHAEDMKVIGATLLPYEGAAYYTEEGNQVRMAVNEFIRNSGEFDGVIEFDLAVRDPDNPNRLRADYTEDNLHPNDAGYRAMATIIDLGLFR